MISSRAVTDGVSLSVSSLMFVDNKLTLTCSLLVTVFFPAIHKLFNLSDEIGNRNIVYAHRRDRLSRLVYSTRTELNKSTELHDAFIGHARQRHNCTSR